MCFFSEINYPVHMNDDLKWTFRSFQNVYPIHSCSQMNLHQAKTTDCHRNMYILNAFNQQEKLWHTTLNN